MGTSKYTPELKARALEMVEDARDEHPSEYAAIVHVAQLLNITTPETLRKWVRQAEVDRGAKPGVSTAESEQVRALKREVAELKRANGILKAAAGFFAAELDRPHR
ncbi:transposase [Tsukamurella pseudospumae]|uniref:Transposase n=1 Tax=Tsukamurella pseudospumae TaxID=239498 RepID=A0A138AMF0_9ACTN|nr:transposase [Tsukamurella pseudospumae]KXP10748.1 transposase [Tsukamurella pseudospumae]KXP11618.1 transposase [Tsukamurella pseudospumae]KXP11897.1 transposase [Tsukamurella pseudospumae]